MYVSMMVSNVHLDVAINVRMLVGGYVRIHARRIMPINVCGTAYHALPVPAAVETRPCVALVGRMQIARPCGILRTDRLTRLMALWRDSPFLSSMDE